MKPFIELINHASVLIGNSKYSILSDPWYSGSAFDDGWSLLYENKKEEIINVLNRTTHIWISHEHPDHFSINFFKEYNKYLKDKIFLFQKTKDKRVVNFLKSENLEVLEIDNNENIKIDENFEFCIQKSDFYDSALIIKLEDKKIFNINDCPLKNEEDILDFKKKHGECDILLSQFSYAAWKGGRENIKWRKLAASEKINSLKLQSKLFNPKLILPFASFIYFSNILNFYLNDSINLPEKITKEMGGKENNLIFLKPYQQIELTNYENNKNNYSFWQEKFLSLDKKKIISNNPKILYEDLNLYFETYYSRIMSKNSEIFLKFLKFVPLINTFRPIVINLADLKINIYIDITQKIFKKTSKKAEISLLSKSLKLIFLQDFGFDTLTVNGCFEEIEKNSFIKLAKNFSVGNLNNMGIRLDFKFLFNVKMILLYLKKIFYVEKKLSYKLIKEIE